MVQRFSLRRQYSKVSFDTRASFSIEVTSVYLYFCVFDSTVAKFKAFFFFILATSKTTSDVLMSGRGISTGVSFQISLYLYQFIKMLGNIVVERLIYVLLRTAVKTRIHSCHLTSLVNDISSGWHAFSVG